MTNIVSNIDKLDFAFQPIVNTYSGKIFAVEALIRNTHYLGFNEISDFFDYIYKKEMLFEIDNILREKALKKYKKIGIKDLKLFYNVDNRFFTVKDFKLGTTFKLLQKLDIGADKLCFELTEHFKFDDQKLFVDIINSYKKYGYSIAIDDFGTGISGLHLLYISDTNYIKIDKFFIQNINIDHKKKLFCASLVDMAHIMGIKVIAEGVENIAEYYTCKDLKIDFIQGYLVSKPTLNVEDIKKSYTKLKFFKEDKRVSFNNKIDKSYIERIEPISDSSTLHDLFIYFKEHTRNTFVPVVDKNSNILGAIYEVDIKKISYSQYGLALSKNDSFRAKLKHFIKPVPQIDIKWGIDKALEIFHMMNDAKGIYVTKENKYYGFISLNNLLSLSYKRNLEIAQNQNPLTKLPGNKQIEVFLHTVFSENLYSNIVYFDFNDFKPFNDKYGFRQGDRAILIFSELLQKTISSENFIAHIGGDDFFIGFLDKTYEEVYEIVKVLMKTFEINVSSLYSKEDVNRKYIIAKDRFGVERSFNLLSVCAAIVEINEKASEEKFNEMLGKIKKQSKLYSLPYGISIGV